MPLKSPWHSKLKTRTKVYHDNTACTDGNGVRVTGRLVVVLKRDKNGYRLRHIPGSSATGQRERCVEDQTGAEDVTAAASRIITHQA